MPKIGYLIISEDVFGGEKEMIVKNPYNAIAPYALPGNFSFVVAFSILDLEPRKLYKLTIELLDPNGNHVIPKQDMNFDYAPPEGIVPKIHAGAVNLSFNNVIFRVPGTHTFSVSIDGNAKSLEMPVFASGE